jgi:transposase
MMVMTLCLMVYSCAQHFLRQALVENKDTIPNQLGKLTEKPTMKWIFRLFHGIHVLKLQLNDQVQEMVLNVTEVLRKIILYFGDFACRIYDIQPNNA